MRITIIVYIYFNIYKYQGVWFYGTLVRTIETPTTKLCLV